MKEDVAMPKGKVKEYNQEKGMGIIIDFDTNQPLTVYANYINLKEGDVLKVDQQVEYEVEQNRHKNWAINVRILSTEQ